MDNRVRHDCSHDSHFEEGDGQNQDHIFDKGV